MYSCFNRLDLLGDLLGQGIFNVDGHSWSSQRKLANHEFSTRSLMCFAFDVLREEVETRIVPILSTAADVGTTMDLQDVFRRFAFDVVCKVSLGWDPDCLDLTRPVNPLAEVIPRLRLVLAVPRSLFTLFGRQSVC